MPNDIRKLKRLMYAANHLKKNNPVILKGQPIGNSRALQYAWWFENFRSKLSKGVYRFSYFKIEGSIREAVGTLDLTLIPDDNLPKSGIDPETLVRQETFTYYDLRAKGWRSFRLDLFIGFVQQCESND